jgi:F-type H+-transporting ATPase subunit delta
MAVAQRIYAKALFDAAKEQGRLAEVRRDFADFVEALASSAELASFLSNPKVDARAKREGLAAVFADADELFRNFLRVTADKGRLGDVDDIYHEFERLVAEEERILDVELVTAYELTDDEAKEIVEKIERASGRRVEARRSVDPSLIGGIVLQAGSFLADASIRGRLSALRQELASRS